MSHYPSADPETKVTTVVLRRRLGDAVVGAVEHRGDLAITVARARVLEALEALKTDPELDYDLLLDVCGVDWLGREPRFEVVYHLVSLKKRHRVRLKIAVPEDDPSVPTAVHIYKSADWFEREAFDLYGIVFRGHPDLRRILTDYGFVGHPFRKDFPISGHVEMRYDPDQKRVVYQPVSIEPREVVPRVIREDHYGDSGREK